MNVSDTYKRSLKKRKYSDDYFQLGFSLTENQDCLRNARKSWPEIFYLSQSFGNKMQKLSK